MILRLLDNSERIWKSNGRTDSMELLITLFLDFSPPLSSPYHLLIITGATNIAFFNILCFMIAYVMTCIGNQPYYAEMNRQLSYRFY